MNRQCCLLTLSIVLGCASVTYGQPGSTTPTPIPTPSPMEVTSVDVFTSREVCRAVVASIALSVREENRLHVQHRS